MVLKASSVLFLIPLLILSACEAGSEDNRTNEEAEVTRDVPYREIDGVTLLLDVYRPAGEGPFPSVLVLYGRAWRDGSKEGAGRVAAALAQEGFVAFAPEYREAPPGGRWHAPDPFLDVMAAATWVRENARRYGADPDRLGALGWSAGGNLAMLLGTRGRTLGAGVDAVVSWSGPTDLRSLSDSMGTAEDLLLENYLGCARSSCPDLWRQMSPIEQVDAESAPILIANSEQELVPIGHAEAMFRRLQEAGIASSQLEVVEGSGHGTGLAEQVRDESLEFLRQTLQSQ